MSIKPFQSSYTKTSIEISVIWMWLLQFRQVKASLTRDMFCATRYQICLASIKLQNPIGCSCNDFQCEDHYALRFLHISTALPHTLSNFVRSFKFQPIATGGKAGNLLTLLKCLRHICQLCFLCPLCAQGLNSFRAGPEVSPFNSASHKFSWHIHCPSKAWINTSMAKNNVRLHRYVLHVVVF